MRNERGGKNNKRRKKKDEREYKRERNVRFGRKVKKSSLVISPKNRGKI